MKRVLLIIDGNNCAHRAYNALPKTLHASDGTPTNLIFGSMRMLHSYIDRFQATHLVVAFDSKGATARKQEIFPTYKADREPVSDSGFWSQMDLWGEVIRSMNGYTLSQMSEEADDIIYTVASREKDNFDEIYIVTVDHDMLQCLLSDNIKILRPVPQKQEELWTLKRVLEEYGTDPGTLPALWATKGESSDNLPPASSEEEFDKLLSLITLRELEAVYISLVDSINIKGLKEMYERLEFKSLLKKLE